jgi:sterol desaturase/sphingolipid hydroxylase (fatty acid hydroxylase superfamily)
VENALNKIPAHLRPRSSGTDQIFKNRWLEIFTRTHMLLHYKYSENMVFGVSTILWDKIFNTMPPKEE